MNVISIVNHNHNDQIINLLEDLSNQVLIEKFLIIITNNLNSEAQHINDFKKLNIFFINNTVPYGFSKNHNNAFKIIKSNIFIVLNPDIRIKDNRFLLKSINIINNNNCDLLVPTIYNNDDSIADSIRNNITPISILLRFFISKSKRNLFNNKKFVWFGGMCMILRSDTFSKINGFDEKFYLYCEDYDLCARMFTQNYFLYYCGDISLTHIGSRASHKNIKYFCFHIKSLILVWLSFVFWKVLYFDIKNFLKIK